MTFPAPVIEVAIEPKTKGDQDKLATAIQRLAGEDPTFQVHSDRRPARPSSRAWANCTSRVLVDRMKPGSSRVEANVGKPQVAYRDGDRAGGQRTYTHKKQTGGSGQFGRVIIALEPNA